MYQRRISPYEYGLPPIAQRAQQGQQSHGSVSNTTGQEQAQQPMNPMSGVMAAHQLKGLFQATPEVNASLPGLYESAPYATPFLDSLAAPEAGNGLLDYYAGQGAFDAGATGALDIGAGVAPAMDLASGGTLAESGILAGEAGAELAGLGALGAETGGLASLGALGPAGLGLAGVFGLGSLFDWW
jgi:hypothetical protein